MKKLIAISMLLITTASHASWWGHLDGGVRAAIIGGSALILNNTYQNSELKHQRDLDKLDTQIRREYEAKAVAENARRKYQGSGVPGRLQVPTANNYSGQGYQNQQTGQGRVIYSDGRTQVIELADGTRITLNQ
ncbi:hypothetical protein [Fusobacterium sp.]|uniref:hypothetical protein n=1 Tax=Fusobacterium sp. TaxID=68766 RepID=UPI00396C31CC